jgi:hypothetical protein
MKEKEKKSDLYMYILFLLIIVSTLDIITRHFWKILKWLKKKECNKKSKFITA